MANIPALRFKEAIIWNDLPSNISSYNMFEKKVKEYVIKK